MTVTHHKRYAYNVTTTIPRKTNTKNKIYEPVQITNKLTSTTAYKPLRHSISSLPITTIILIVILRVGIAFLLLEVRFDDFNTVAITDIQAVELKKVMSFCNMGNHGDKNISATVNLLSGTLAIRDPFYKIHERKLFKYTVATTTTVNHHAYKAHQSPYKAKVTKTSWVGHTPPNIQNSIHSET